MGYMQARLRGDEDIAEIISEYLSGERSHEMYLLDDIPRRKVIPKHWEGEFIIAYHKARELGDRAIEWLSTLVLTRLNSEWPELPSAIARLIQQEPSIASYLVAYEYSRNHNWEVDDEICASAVQSYSRLSLIQKLAFFVDGRVSELIGKCRTSVSDDKPR